MEDLSLVKIDKMHAADNQIFLQGLSYKLYDWAQVARDCPSVASYKQLQPLVARRDCPGSKVVEREVHS